MALLTDGGPLDIHERNPRPAEAGAVAASGAPTREPFEIVQIVQELSAAGGVETVAWELARTFSQMGLPNRVITSRVGSGLDPRVAVERVAPWLSSIPTRGRFRYLGRAVVVPLFTLAATRALRGHRSAIVISHGDSLAGDVLVVHAVNAESLSEKRRNGEWRWLLNPMHAWVALRDRWMIGGLRFRRYLAVSGRVRRELQAHYGVPTERVEVIPNGIDLARFNVDPAAGPAIRRAFGIGDDAKLLLFVGHEFGRKGLAHAVDALTRLPPEYRLLVVGSDNPAPYRVLAGPRAPDLIFAGARSDMPAFYAAADALVLPSSYETFSLVCMEAMACGVPAFATAVGGIEEYLEDGVNGCFVTPDGARIAEVIARAFADPARLAAMGANARATARSYAWDRIGRSYIALAERIFAEKAGRAAGPIPTDDRRAG